MEAAVMQAQANSDTAGHKVLYFGYSGIATHHGEAKEISNARATLLLLLSIGLAARGVSRTVGRDGQRAQQYIARQHLHVRRRQVLVVALRQVVQLIPGVPAHRTHAISTMKPGDRQKTEQDLGPGQGAGKGL